MATEFDVVFAALNSGALNGKTFDTARVDSTGQLVRAAYAVLFGGVRESVADARFSRDHQPGDGWNYPFTIRAVAPDPGGVRYVMDIAIANLVGKRLTLASRSLSAIQFERATSPVDDDSVTPPMYFADLDVNLTSIPA